MIFSVCLTRGSDRLLSVLPSSPPRALSLSPATGPASSSRCPRLLTPRRRRRAQPLAGLDLRRRPQAGPPLPPPPPPQHGRAVPASPRFVACDLCQHSHDLSLSFHRKKLFPVICANEEDKQCRGRLKVEDEQCAEAG